MIPHDSTFGKYTLVIFVIFRGVGSLKLKLKPFFKLKIKLKSSIESPPCPRLKWTAEVSFCLEKRTSRVDSHSVLSRRTKFLARLFSPGEGSGVT